MRKLNSSYTSYVMFDLKKRYSSFFISSLLVGGVLLCLAFSLIPSDVSAYTTNSFPDGVSGTNNFTAYTRGGCIFKDYVFNDGASGAYISPFTNNKYCGAHYNSNDHALSQLADSGNSVQAPLEEWDYSGSSFSHIGKPVPSGSAFSDPLPPNDFIPKLYSTIPQIKWYNYSSDYIYINSNNIASRTYALMAFSFGLNGQYWNIGVKPFINCQTSFRIFKTSDNSEISIYSDVFQSICDEINHAGWFTASSIASKLDTSGLPDGASIPDSNFDYQSIIYFAFPTSPNYYYRFNNDFTFTSNILSVNASSSDFFNSFSQSWQTTEGVNLASNPLSLNFLFRQAPSDFYSSAVSGSSWRSNFFDTPKIQIFVCTTAEECDSFKNLHDYYTNKSDDSLKPGVVSSSDPISSIFESWFSVFQFNFLFPFRSLFTSFTNSECVDIPIIGGMLHASNTHYCTWWSSDIRNILTPVFNLFAMMLLTGFIMHWLGYNNKTDSKIIGSLAKNKGGE